jgi:hypothetical protein
VTLDYNDNGDGSVSGFPYILLHELPDDESGRALVERNDALLDSKLDKAREILIPTFFIMWAR